MRQRRDEKNLPWHVWCVPDAFSDTGSNTITDRFANFSTYLCPYKGTDARPISVTNK